MEHVTWTNDGMKLLIERSKTDGEGEGAGPGGDAAGMRGHITEVTIGHGGELVGERHLLRETERK